MTKRLFAYSVAAGIVASVVFSVLLRPVSAWLWNEVGAGAATALTGLQNAAIRNAAIGERAWFGTVTTMAAGWLVLISPLLILLEWKLLHRIRAFRDVAAVAQYKRYLRTLLAIAYLGLVIDWAFLSFMSYVDLQMNASFSRRFDAAAPYMDVAEEESLRSSWALMTTIGEYRQINARLDEVARTGGVDLPRPLYR